MVDFRQCPAAIADRADPDRLLRADAQVEPNEDPVWKPLEDPASEHVSEARRDAVDAEQRLRIQLNEEATA